MKMKRKRKRKMENIGGGSTMDALLNFVLPFLKKEEEENRRMEDLMKLVLLLPPEIITEILSRLPADSAIGCRCICKQWRSLIDHPSFCNYRPIPNSSSCFFLCAQQQDEPFLCAQQQQDEDSKYYKLEVIEYNDDGSEFKPSKPITYQPFSFLCDTWGSLKISSCNGLVFMGSDKPYINTLVCNPFTREHLRIPTPLFLEKKERKGYMAYGFGYLPSTNEYKVVSIYYDDDDDNEKKKAAVAGMNKGKVGVYTLGSGKWRNNGEIPFWIKNTPSYLGGFANGAIHWFTENQDIVSFDLANEEFRLVVPLPPPAVAVASYNYAVTYGVLGGSLCVTRSDHTTGLKEIWVLNVLTTNDNKEEFSWNKKLNIPTWNGYMNYHTPRVVTKSGKILLFGGSGSDLVSYDPKTEKFVYGKAFPQSKWVKVVPYTKSLVSLKALGEKDAKCFGRGSVTHAQTLAQQLQ